MRNLQVFFGFAISLAALSVSAHPDTIASNAVLMPRQTAEPSPSGNPTPTGGVGEVIQGDVDETPEDTSQPEETNAEKTEEPIITTDQNGSTITKAPEETGTNNPGSRTSSSRSKKISADAQPGGVQMKTPSALDGYQIYKINDPITFVWNFTSLQVTPTALNVEAYCTDGAQFFPIAMNVSADTTQVVWDTEEYQRTGLVKFPVATYTLYIYDQARGATSFPSPGYLQPFSGLTFGLYTPKLPTPLSSFECSTCDPSSASTFDAKTLRFILGMGVVTALSFVWFVAGVL